MGSKKIKKKKKKIAYFISPTKKKDIFLYNTDTTPILVFINLLTRALFLKIRTYLENHTTKINYTFTHTLRAENRRHYQLKDYQSTSHWKAA